MIYYDDLFEYLNFTSIAEDFDYTKSSVFEYIEIFYNRKRRHSYLGLVSPMDFEYSYNQRTGLSHGHVKPHKPIMMLAILSLIENRKITSNKMKRIGEMTLKRRSSPEKNKLNVMTNLLNHKK